MTIRDPLARWHADHVNFARLLDFLEERLELFGAGEAPDYELMLDIVYYMTHYSDVIHHPKEDVVFAIVMHRAPELARTVNELLGEHAALKDSGEQLARDLDDVVNGSIAPRERVERSAREYIALMRGHMNVEEAQIFPAAQRLLRPGDWKALEPAMRQADDPLFGAAVEARYASLREQIERHARTGA